MWSDLKLEGSHVYILLVAMEGKVNKLVEIITNKNIVVDAPKRSEPTWMIILKRD
jgi:hypothetical protein